MIIDQELTQAFNAKPKVNINNIKDMTAGQLDAVKVYGSAAENLLLNRDFALFVHHFKFDMAAELTAIKSHSPDDNAHRVSIAHYIAGIDKFVESLQRAVYYKSRAVSQQSPTQETQGI
jgi:nitrate/nitrite-specific signal transduction histidine kinase